MEKYNKYMYSIVLDRHMVRNKLHSWLSKDLIESHPPLIEPPLEEKALLGGPEYGFRKILANRAG